MTSRGPVGTSNRQDLFQKTARSARSDDRPIRQNEAINMNNGNDLIQEDIRIHKEFGLGDPEESLLQLDRVIGCIGDCRNTLIMSPTDENRYFRGLGCLVSFDSISEMGQQKCLRAHDMTVSSLSCNCRVMCKLRPNVCMVRFQH
jgi:hypothetical protein